MKNKAAKVARTAHDADRKLSKRAAEVRDAPPVRVAAIVGEVADQPPLIALSAATIIVGAALRRPTLARIGTRMLASHLVATGIKTVIKRRIDRTRPHAAHDGDAYKLESGGDHGHNLASFPSGHTAGAVAVARAIARDVPESATLGALGAGAVAAIQLPNAKHYASDVAAGAVVGVVGEWVATAGMTLAARGWRSVTGSIHADPVAAVGVVNGGKARNKRK